MEPSVLLRVAAENDNMSSIDRLVNIGWALRLVTRLEVPGDVVEVGCNAGRTSVYLRMLLDELDPARTLHVYDSFEGLPQPGRHDAYLREGECAASTADLAEVFHRWNVGLPQIHAGWFEDTLPAGLPARIAFAYLDGDFHDSILVALERVWPRLSVGGIVLVDDYGDRARNPNGWEGLPGVKRAVDGFFARRAATVEVLVGASDLSMACIEKRHVTGEE